MIAEKLKQIGLVGEIQNDNETLIKFSHDASLFEVRPDVVVAPNNSSDIQKIVNFVREEKRSDRNVSITPRAAGTCMSGGSLNTSIILDFTKHINHIVEVGDNYAVVEPGVYYRDFEKETLKKDLIYAPYPASKGLCALGGMVGNNCAGEKTLSYGKTENFVLELKVVLQDGNEYIFKALNETELKEKLAQQNFEGEVYRKIHKLLEDNYEVIKAAKPNVSKNSAGYFLWNVWDKEKGVFDLTKLFVGSQGTLGVITEIKVRLVPNIKHSKLLVLFLSDLKNLAQITNTVLGFNPECFESYDDKTLKLAVRFLPSLVKIMHPKNILKLAFQFIPEAWMALTSGMPKLVLMAEFTGNDLAEIDKKIIEAKQAVSKYGLKARISGEEESKKYWTIRRESFNLLRQHIHGKRTAPFIDDIIVRPEHLPEFLPQLNKILSEYDLIYTIAGHVGDGNFHIIPLMDMHNRHTHDVIIELSKRVYDLVLNFKGSITAEHNDGLIRSPFLKQMYGDKIYSFFEETKKIFDPLNIFNPGKKVGSDLNYAMDHIVKE